MINPQLLDYIKQQLQQGINKEQIRSSLMISGWQAQDVEEAFASIGTATQTQQNVIPITKSPMKMWKIIGGSLLGLIVIGGGIYFFTRKPAAPETKTAVQNNQSQQQPASATPSLPQPQETPIATTTVATSDCGKDFNCFIQASQSCKLAKVDNSVTTDIFGIKQTTESLLEIKGLEATKCVFAFVTKKIDLIFPSSVPAETVNQQKALYKKLEGTSGVCTFKTTDLTATLTRWKQGDFSTDDLSAANCSGTYLNPPSL